MLGLTNYESSDDEEAKEELKETAKPTIQDVVSNSTAKVEPKHAEPAAVVASNDSAAPIGPTRPPTGDEDAISDANTPPVDPRQQIRDLTLPPLPNLDIPPSPPGDAPTAATAKFDRFLALKGQGVHFNARLAQSSALRNPTLLLKLLDFAGISESYSDSDEPAAGSQYAESLPRELQVAPAGGFPSWAYADELNKRQEELRKQRENERSRGGAARDVAFVAASKASSRMNTSRAGAGTTGSTAERVHTGLEREGKRSRENEQRRSRFDDGDGRSRNRSRSP